MAFDLYSDIAPIAAVGLVLFYILAVVSAVEAILRGRTSQGAIAWVTGLIAFPYLAVPLYLVFGRNRFAGYLEERDTVESESRHLIKRTRGTIEEHIVSEANRASIYRSLFKLARMPATTGNEVKLLIDGTATFDSIEAGLRGARNYILFQFYILRDDALGQRLGRVLADRARAGVKVFLLYDEIGSPGFARSKLHRQLKTVGVQVAPFNTTQGRRNRFQLNFRNHRKVVVVDGEAAWIGGHNVGVEYLGQSKRFGHWRDTHVRLAGPAVLGAEVAFATDWQWATRTLMDIDWDTSPRAQGDSEVLVFPSDPASEYEEAGLMYHQSIVAARERLWIASPYFVPDNAIISALQLAALRGVDVRVLIPDEPDGRVVGMANWSFTRQLLPLGVRVYRYQGGFMHQKVMLVDSEACGIGTANFDNRSFRLNFEITVLVQDTGFASEVAAMLEADIAHCREVSLQELKDKPVWFTLAMGAARLLAPVL
ncbi:MAG: cardiolipin synthase [Halioglobus sp.]